MKTLGTKIRELALVILSIFGLADTLFLFVQDQKGTVGQFCEVLVGAFGANCERVLTSRYAEVAGIGLILWGILYYISLVWITIWARFDPGSSRAPKFFLAAISGVGLATSVFLTYLQAFVIKAWCPFCLISAAITALIFILSLVELVRVMRPAPAGVGDAGTWGRGAADPETSALGARPTPEADAGLPSPELSLASAESNPSGSAVGALVFLCVILASGLAVTWIYKTPERAASTLDQMMRYVPRRITPPGGLIYGNDTAPVTVQAFLDYTCQHCRNFESAVFPRIKAGFVDSGRVKWVNKILPHANSGAPVLFGIAGVCGRTLSDSAAIERALFGYPIPSPKTGMDALTDAFQLAGVKPSSSASVIWCVQNTAADAQKQVFAEAQQAFTYGLRGPPAFVIDGIAFQGLMDHRTMSDLLEIFLRQHGS